MSLPGDRAASAQHAGDDVARQQGGEGDGGQGREDQREAAVHGVLPLAPGGVADGAGEAASAGTKKSFGPAQKLFPQAGAGENFSTRAAAALTQRVYPRTTLHLKVLAHAIGVSAATLANLRQGRNEPLAGLIDRLNKFFWSQGDYGFVFEVYGMDPGVPRGEMERERALRAELEQRMRRVREIAA